MDAVGDRQPRRSDGNTLSDLYLFTKPSDGIPQFSYRCLLITNAGLQILQMAQD